MHLCSAHTLITRRSGDRHNRASSS